MSTNLEKEIDKYAFLGIGTLIPFEEVRFINNGDVYIKGKKDAVISLIPGDHQKLFENYTKWFLEKKKSVKIVKEVCPEIQGGSILF